MSETGVVGSWHGIPEQESVKGGGVMGSHYSGGTHGYIVPGLTRAEEYEHGLENWNEARVTYRCPVCGKLHLVPACFCDADIRELDVEMNEYMETMCSECTKEAEKSFGEKAVNALLDDGEEGFVAITLREAKYGLKVSYTGFWCGTARA